MFLASPETAAASALTGQLADPRRVADELKLEWTPPAPPERGLLALDLLEAPPAEPENGRERTERFPLEKGANVGAMPHLEELPDQLQVEVALKVGDDISTDEILPAGAKVLPYRSNIEKISEFCFGPVDERYVERAKASRESGGHAIVGGRNYGQGSSREHAALAPKTLGLKLALARSFARIHRDNLINFGVLPVELQSDEDYQKLRQGQRLRVSNLHEAIADRQSGHVDVEADQETLRARLNLSDRQREVLRAGGLINWWKAR